MSERNFNRNGIRYAVLDALAIIAFVAGLNSEWLLMALITGNG